jgi:hypothetical protein
MTLTQTMPRKTIHLPESAERLVKEHAREGESFSATVVRLIELGAAEDLGFEGGQIDDSEFPLGYIGSGESGLPDLGINTEKYLGLKPWGPGEAPADEDSG